MSDLSVTEDPRLFRVLFDQMPQLGWTARADGFIDYYNAGWYEYTGSTIEQMAGWGWKSVHDPATVDSVTKRWQAAISSGSPFEMEFRLRRHDGQFRWFLTRADPIRDDSGQIVRWVGINSDITLTRELRQSLDQERLDLRELFELAPAFMAKLREPSHVFEVANPAYMRLVGPARTIIGLPVLEALPEVAGQGFVELLDAVYETGVPFIGNEMPVMLRVGDEMEEKFVNFVYQATKDSEGKVNGIFAHGTDVTAQVQARRQVEQQAKALRQANQVKDEFLATLSHELRTPMTAVLGWAKLLQMGLSASEAQVAIDAIEQSAEKQAQLIDDVLDISRITSGKLAIDPRPVDLVTVAQAAIRAIHPAATAKSIELLTSFPPVLPQVSGDEGRLQQVLWNLLANAVKFTLKGGTVTMRLTQVGSTVQVRVTDTGQGIDPSFVPHLFEPFRQGDNSLTREHGGIGLGLSIVKKIVELHGGMVSASSEGEGRGATFSVELPVLESRATAAGLREVPEDPPLEPARANLPDLSAATVLVIDDQDFTRNVVVAIMRQARATVLVASSVREGLAQLEEHRPDVVVCDIAMPKEDGYVFVREVRALTDERARTPIIALTAFGRPEDRKRALEAGFNSYLKKPVDPIELAEAVWELTAAES